MEKSSVCLLYLVCDCCSRIGPCIVSSRVQQNELAAVLLALSKFLFLALLQIALRLPSVRHCILLSALAIPMHEQKGTSQTS